MERITLSNKIAWQILPNKEFVYVCNLKTRQYYQFDDSAMKMWLSIANNEPISRENLVKIVADYYEIEEIEIKEDVDEFLNSLYQEGLIVINE